MPKADHGDFSFAHEFIHPPRGGKIERGTKGASQRMMRLPQAFILVEPIKTSEWVCWSLYHNADVISRWEFRNMRDGATICANILT